MLITYLDIDLGIKSIHKLAKFIKKISNKIYKLKIYYKKIDNLIYRKTLCKAINKK